MRIACPECNAAYDVSPAQLAPGRAARCARCGTVWTPVATEDARPPIPAAVVEPRPAIAPLPGVAPEAPPEPPTEQWPATAPDLDHAPPVPQPVPEPGSGTEPRFDDVPDPGPAMPAAAPTQGPAPPRRAGPSVLVAWLLTVVVLVGLGVSAVWARSAIVAAWPPAGRAYQALGLAP